MFIKPYESSKAAGGEILLLNYNGIYVYIVF